MIIAIGDLHGNNGWKKAVEDNPGADRVVFLGDYMDSQKINWAAQVQNLEDVLAYKAENPNKIVLLTGNHDHHYKSHCVKRGIHYSGFKGHLVPRITPLIDKAVGDGVLQAVYEEDSILFSHAGISEVWCERKEISPHGDFVKKINELHRTNPEAFGFQHGKYSERTSVYGDNPFQSPFWIRPPSLRGNAFLSKKYKQVVGHTEQRELNVDTTDLVFIDTLNTTGEYLLIHNGNLTPRSI